MDTIDKRQRGIEQKELRLIKRQQQIRLNAIKRAKQKRTETLDKWAEAIMAREAGFAWKEIAEQYGVSPETVCGCVTRLRPDLKIKRAA